MNESLSKSILATIHYADLFQYPLSLREIQRYLYLRKASLAEVQQEVSTLLASNLLETNGEWYVLSSRSLLFELRLQREQISSQHRQRIQKWLKIFSLLSWVNMVGITGSLAMNNSSEQDDIDLMMVTSPRRLWLTRFLLVPVLYLGGVYWRKNTPRGRFCPNVWLTTDDLKFEDHGVYLAHEICQTQPIFIRGSVYQEFLSQNAWVYRYFPNWEGGESPHALLESPRKQISRLGDKFERWAFSGQMFKIKRRWTSEVVTPSRALFHPLSVAPHITTAFEERLRQINEGFSRRGDLQL